MVAKLRGSPFVYCGKCWNSVKQCGHKMVASGVDSADDSITEFIVLALITSAQKSHRTGNNHLCSGSQNQLSSANRSPFHISCIVPCLI